MSQASTRRPLAFSLNLLLLWKGCTLPQRVQWRRGRGVSCATSVQRTLRVLSMPVGYSLREVRHGGGRGKPGGRARQGPVQGEVFEGGSAEVPIAVLRRQAGLEPPPSRTHAQRIDGTGGPSRSSVGAVRPAVTKAKWRASHRGEARSIGGVRHSWEGRGSGGRSAAF